ncbi:MAG: DUF488 family protein [Chloroflexota bacterium]
MSDAPRIYALGHSTRSVAELVELLRQYGVVTLADVRRFPGSRRNPQFNRETVTEALGASGIRDGLRPSRRASTCCSSSVTRRRSSRIGLDRRHQEILNLEYDLDVLGHKPGALAGSKTMESWRMGRCSGTWGAAAHRSQKYRHRRDRGSRWHRPPWDQSHTEVWA